MPPVYRRINLNTKVISFFSLPNMEEYHLKYHDDVYTDFLMRVPWGCAAGWGRIFTTELTIMGSHFQ